MDTNKNEKFLMVPYTIIQNKELKDGDKMTLALIYSFYNNKKEMYMSNSKLGKILGISRTAASERITKLETLGYIKCERLMVNGKEQRTIVPLKMVGEPKPLVGTPNPLVGEPNPLVGTPNGISRSTDTSLVGEVGSIIYPLLNNKLNKVLHTLPHKELNNEKPVDKELLEAIKEKIDYQFVDVLVELVSNNQLTSKQRNLILDNKFKLIKTIPILEQYITKIEY